MRTTFRKTAVLAMAVTAGTLTLWAGVSAAAPLRAPRVPEVSSVAPPPPLPTRGIEDLAYTYVDRAYELAGPTVSNAKYTVDSAIARAIGIAGPGPIPSPPPGIIPNPGYLPGPGYIPYYVGTAQAFVNDAIARAIGIAGPGPIPSPPPGIIPDPRRLPGVELPGLGGDSSPVSRVAGTVYNAQYTAVTTINSAIARAIGIAGPGPIPSPPPGIIPDPDSLVDDYAYGGSLKRIVAELPHP